MERKPVNVNSFMKFKNQNHKITMLTAYDYSTAKIVDEAGIDGILVGDSLAMVALGYENTMNVTVEEMLIFTKAVARGVKSAFVVADMPFMSYQASIEEGIKNAGEFIKAGAKAVKIEGGSDYTAELIKRLTESGIPVLAHLGFTPQFINSLGGHYVQGKSAENTKKILEEARKMECAGAFAVVLEMVPEESAKYITENIVIPTIGIGAGRYCSGQILVTDDIIGKYSDFIPKFVKKYTDIYTIIKSVAQEYINDVQTGIFPEEKNVFKLDEVEGKKLYDVFNKNN